MLIAYGVVNLSLFVVIELEREAPLLNVRIFRYWPFVNSLLLITINSVALFSALFYIPLFLQEGRDMQAFATGLLLAPPALVMLVMMPVAGRLFDLIGPRIPAVVGMTINGIGTWMLTGINADVTRHDVVVWMMIRSFGIGLSMMPIMTGGISALPPSMVSVGSAFNNVVQRVAGAFGIAALTALSTGWQAQRMADRSALLRPGADADDRMVEMARQGFAGMYPMMRQLRLETMASSYSAAFQVIALLTFAGAVLSLFLRNGPPKADAGREAAEVG